MVPSLPHSGEGKALITALLTTLVFLEKDKIKKLLKT